MTAIAIFLSAIATTITGAPTKVECDLHGYPNRPVAYADLHWRIAYIRPDLCRALVAPAIARGGPARRAAYAALVLGHELGHIQLGAGEHTAACYGLEHVTAIGRELSWDATRLFYALHYAYQADVFQQPSCRRADVPLFEAPE